MATLSETQPWEILIFIVCGEKTKSQQHACDLFNTILADQ